MSASTQLSEKEKKAVSGAKPSSKKSLPASQPSRSKESKKQDNMLIQNPSISEEVEDENEKGYTSADRRDDEDEQGDRSDSNAEEPENNDDRDFIAAGGETASSFTSQNSESSEESDREESHKRRKDRVSADAGKKPAASAVRGLKQPSVERDVKSSSSSSNKAEYIKDKDKKRNNNNKSESTNKRMRHKAPRPQTEQRAGVYHHPLQIGNYALSRINSKYYDQYKRDLAAAVVTYRQPQSGMSLVPPPPPTAPQLENRQVSVKRTPQQQGDDVRGWEMYVSAYRKYIDTCSQYSEVAGAYMPVSPLDPSLYDAKGDSTFSNVVRFAFPKVYGQYTPSHIPSVSTSTSAASEYITSHVTQPSSQSTRASESKSFDIALSRKSNDNYNKNNSNNDSDSQRSRSTPPDTSMLLPPQPSHSLFAHRVAVRGTSGSTAVPLSPWIYVEKREGIQRVYMHEPLHSDAMGYSVVRWANRHQVRATLYEPLYTLASDYMRNNQPPRWVFIPYSEYLSNPALYYVSVNGKQLDTAQCAWMHEAMSVQVRDQQMELYASLYKEYYVLLAELNVYNVSVKALFVNQGVEWPEAPGSFMPLFPFMKHMGEGAKHALKKRRAMMEVIDNLLVRLCDSQLETKPSEEELQGMYAGMVLRGEIEGDPSHGWTPIPMSVHVQQPTPRAMSQQGASYTQSSSSSSSLSLLAPVRHVSPTLTVSTSTERRKLTVIKKPTVNALVEEQEPMQSSGMAQASVTSESFQPQTYAAQLVSRDSDAGKLISSLSKQQTHSYDPALSIGFQPVWKEVVGKCPLDKNAFYFMQAEAPQLVVETDSVGVTSKRDALCYLCGVWMTNHRQGKVCRRSPAHGIFESIPGAPSRCVECGCTRGAHKAFTLAPLHAVTYAVADTVIVPPEMDEQVTSAADQVAMRLSEGYSSDDRIFDPFAQTDEVDEIDESSDKEDSESSSPRHRSKHRRVTTRRTRSAGKHTIVWPFTIDNCPIDINTLMMGKLTHCHLCNGTVFQHKPSDEYEETFDTSVDDTATSSTSTPMPIVKKEAHRGALKISLSDIPIFRDPHQLSLRDPAFYLKKFERVMKLYKVAPDEWLALLSQRCNDELISGWIRREPSRSRAILG